MKLLNKNKMTENKHKMHNNSYERDHDHHSPSISELTKKEQDYRHKWQDKFIRTSTSTFRLGQVFGLIYNLAVLYLVYDLVQDGEKDLALKIFVLNIGIIAFALLVTSVERKVLTRKPARKSRDRNFKGRGNNNRNDRSRRDDRGDKDRDQKRF